MTMLDVLKKRLPEGVTLVSVKERAQAYEVTLDYQGARGKALLEKTCTPGHHNKVADTSICIAIASALFDLGNYKEAKVWLDKISDLDKVGEVVPF